MPVDMFRSRHLFWSGFLCSCCLVCPRTKTCFARLRVPRCAWSGFLCSRCFMSLHTNKLLCASRSAFLCLVWLHEFLLVQWLHTEFVCCLTQCHTGVGGHGMYWESCADSTMADTIFHNPAGHCKQSSNHFTSSKEANSKMSVALYPPSSGVLKISALSFASVP